MTVHNSIFAAALAAVCFIAGCEECDTGKIAFEREELARFDAVEFCIPRDAAKDRMVLNLSPEVKLMPGSSGRIGCDRMSETLCLLEIHRQPVTNSRAGKGLWKEICGLSRLAFVAEIRGTWLE